MGRRLVNGVDSGDYPANAVIINHATDRRDLLARELWPGIRLQRGTRRDGRAENA